MQPAQEIIRGLWTSSHPQELLLHSLPCLLSFYYSLNCTGNITLVGKRKKKKKFCGLGSHLYICHLQQVVLIINVQRASIILRHFSNVSLLGETMHWKGEVCEKYFGILSPVCVWQPGLGPLPCILSPILGGLWPSHWGSIHREVANGAQMRLLPDDTALAWISKKPCGTISVIRTTIDWVLPYSRCNAWMGPFTSLRQKEMATRLLFLIELVYNSHSLWLFQGHLIVKGFGDASKFLQSIKEIFILLILRREETGFNPLS